MKKRSLFFLGGTCIAALQACTDAGPIQPGFRDVPRVRGMSPSVYEETEARKKGERLTVDQARARVDRLGPTDQEASNGREFNVSSNDASAKNWPVDTITYKAFQNTADRAIYLRRALGRYALVSAEARGLGASLSRARKVSRIASPTTKGEWWVGSVHRADLLSGQAVRKISLVDTINATVKNSYQIAAFGDLPAIRGTAIQEARGRFVPEIFADVSREDKKVWATSPAIAAGDTYAKTKETDAEFGVRGRLPTGGEVSVSQRFTVTDTNRTAYIPSRQTSSKTTVSYIQPLLRGGGVNYNDIPRRIANMDTQIAIEEFHRQASAHLLEVERAYWNLYVARAVYVQQKHLAGHGRQIANQIRNRGSFDADPILVSGAQAKATKWNADLVRAKAAMENAEFRIAALVNDPRLGPGNVEIYPTSAPNGALRLLSTEDTIQSIFVNRPEVQQAILQYEAALLREGMAANESLPELDLVLELSASGGANGRSLGGAFKNQSGGKGSLVGLKFSVPLGFDERDARYHRRRLETVQQERQVLSAISTILLEADVAANEYVVACNDLVAQRKALLAAQSDNRAIQARWDEGVGDGGIDLLSALLNSYENLQYAEQAVAQARATREVSAANLARARGLLLKRWGLEMQLQDEIRDEKTYKLVRRR